MPPPYAADTNIYVRAANEPSFRGRVETFVQRDGPLVVSSVVIAEILVGVTAAGRHDVVIRALSAGTTPLAPHPDDWIAAALAVAGLGGNATTKSRSFWNDALLAAQCFRLQVALITSSVKDFRRLRRHLPVEVLEPFP